jgi:hypothetical protein
VCLNLDVNILHKVFPSPSADHRPVHDALTTLKARLVYGGQLRREYMQTGWFRAFLRRLDQTGAAKAYPDSKVDAQTETIRRAGGYRSNAPHILALATVANVRLLCSEDEDLSRDFRNRKFIRAPRGSVYRRSDHARLLRSHCRGH